MKAYLDFLKAKESQDPDTGLKTVPKLSAGLFEYQRDIVAWALRRGRAAIFADCGMGKTFIQLEWAKHIPGDVLILCPLAVAAQTIREGERFGIPVNRCYSHDDVKPGINITNYDRLDHFDAGAFTGIVLDESSILKSFDGKTRTQLIESFAQTPYRLACTATPSPNDYMELGNHAEFLGVMTRSEMLAMYFAHDGGDTAKWRIKGHGESPFWKWVCSWAVMIRKPSDLGYSDKGFTLPAMKFHERIIRASEPTDGMLFAMPAASLQERISARRDTAEDRAKECAAIVNATPGPWVVWCHLNTESAMLAKMIDGAEEVVGPQSSEVKEGIMGNFSSGKLRVIVSKPSLSGFGMNWQHCANVAFVGLSDSYEEFYQAVRRCWRFGQKKTVNVYMISADTEGAVLENIKRKEAQAAKMAEKMVSQMRGINMENIKGSSKREKSEYKIRVEKSDNWEMRLGDCVEEVSKLKADSVHYSIYSPPFASLYTYSNSDRDMGNSKGDGQFQAHYEFMVRELYRATMPGRLTSFHCMNLPTSKVNHGHIGLRDFRGDLIRIHEKAGWIFHSEVCIWKDPVTAMQRTKALGLLHKQIVKDSCMSRQGIPDYLVTMRKPGDNPERVSGPFEEYHGTDKISMDGSVRDSINVWQRYASPVWMDINPSETLQYRSARENNDERHICPLQLQVIRRGLELWSNPGDTVLSPFAGIGSEGHESIMAGRKFLGIELKESYFNCAVNNLKAAESELKESTLL